MIATISGVFWIFLGCWFLWRPKGFAKRLQKKGRRLMTRYLLIAWGLVAWTLGSLSFEIAGLWPKGLALVLAIALFVVALAVRRRLADALNTHSKLLQPEWIRRIAVGYIAIGLAIIGIASVSARFTEPKPKTTQEAPDVTPSIGEDIDGSE